MRFFGGGGGDRGRRREKPSVSALTPAAALVTVVATLGTAACGGTAQDLGRAERHYRRAEFPKALALLRVVGEDLDELPEDQRARYFYLRGMSDYRIAASLGEGEERATFRGYAREHLLAARGALRETPNALGPDEQGVLDRTLLELSTEDEASGPPRTGAQESQGQ